MSRRRRPIPPPQQPTRAPAKAPPALPPSSPEAPRPFAPPRFTRTPAPWVASDRGPPPSALDRLDLALLIVIVVAGLVATLGPVGTNDIGFHLRLGQEIAAAGPPRTDAHSFTLPGVAYPDHEWLAQLGLYAVYAAFGVPGLAVLQGTLIAITLGLVVASTRAPAALRAVVTLPVLLLAFDHSEVRPHLLGWIYVALLGILLEKRRWFGILGLLLVWANTHASAPLGVGLAGLTALEDLWRTRDRRCFAWGAAIVSVPLLNPYGIHVYTLFLTITGNAGFVGEWLPYPRDSWQFALLVILTAGAGFGLLRRRFDLFAWVRLFVLATLSFQSSRSGVVMAIFFAPHFGRWYGWDVADLGARARRGLTGMATLGVLALTGARVQAGDAARLELDVQHLPVAAVDFVKRHQLEGPIYNDYNFGGYLLWQAPELPVFVDGRIEVYQGKVLDDHLRISRAEPGWEALLDAYGVNLVVVRPERGVAEALLRHTGWDLVYFDYNAVVFVRASRNPGVRVLRVISPKGNRDKADLQGGIAEIRYLIGENPDFFGGHKILAFLLYRRGDYAGAATSLQRYLELHPVGREVAETQEMIAALKKRGAWLD